MIRTSKIDTTEIDCAVCGHEEIILESDEVASCPNCEESYNLTVKKEFALMEWQGWTTRIALHPSDTSTTRLVDG